MDLRELRYFTTLAEELHFRRAAERLHITQAPLSVTIQKLEREVGGQLFHRTQRRVALTELGRAFLEHSEGILAQVNRGLSEVREVALGHAGRLRIGFTPASALLPSFQQSLRAFQRRHPKVDVTLKELSSLGQLTGLQKREIDVGIIRSHNLEAPSDVVIVRLLKDPLIAAMRDDHPLAASETLELGDLRDVPLIFYPRESGAGIYEHFVSTCRKRGFTPAIVQEATDGSTIVGLAATGLGVAVVPSELKCIQLPNLAFRQIDDHEAMTEVSFACRAGEQSMLVAHFRHIACATPVTQ